MLNLVSLCIAEWGLLAKAEHKLEATVEPDCEHAVSLPQQLQTMDSSITANNTTPV